MLLLFGVPVYFISFSMLCIIGRVYFILHPFMICRYMVLAVRD